MDFDRMLRYATDLEANNNRPWFHANHKQYELARADFEELITLIKFRIAEISPSLGNLILFMNSRELMYRIPRDMRVNKGKPPYNPSFRAHFTPDRRGRPPLGYFMRISPHGSDIGTGLFPETTKAINRARGYIDENCCEWLELVENAGMDILGEKLKKVPSGFDPESPVAEWLKHRFWYITHSFEEGDLTTFDEFLDKVTAVLEKLEPIRRFLSEAAVHDDDRF